MNSDLIKNLIIEYINIVDLILSKNKFYNLKDGNIGIEISILDKLLCKHAYLKSRKKLKLWKTLNLIITEKDLYTCKKRVIKDNQRIRTRFYVINLNTFHVLKANLN